jgi:hypothetical protein
MRLPNICASERNSYRSIAEELVRNMEDRGYAVNARVLNSLMEVYRQGEFVPEAMEIVEKFQMQNLLPNKRTFSVLFALFADNKNLHDKFFQLFDEYPHHRTHAVVQRALDLAIDSRSSNKVVKILEVMGERSIFPSSAQAELLAKVGRKVVAIQEAVSALIRKNKETTQDAIKRRDELIQLDMREHGIRLASIGKTTKSPTPAQQARDKFFEKLKKVTGGHSRPFLPLAQYHQLTKRGGELYAKKKDRQGVNKLLL